MWVWWKRRVLRIGGRRFVALLSVVVVVVGAVVVGCRICTGVERG